MSARACLLMACPPALGLVDRPRCPAPALTSIRPLHQGRAPYPRLFGGFVPDRGDASSDQERNLRIAGRDRVSLRRAEAQNTAFVALLWPRFKGRDAAATAAVGVGFLGLRRCPPV